MRVFLQLLLLPLLLIFFAINGQEQSPETESKHTRLENKQQPDPGIRSGSFTIDDLLEGNDVSGQSQHVAGNANDKSVQKSKEQKQQSVSDRDKEKTNKRPRPQDMKPPPPPKNTKQDCKKSKFCYRHALFQLAILDEQISQTTLENFVYSVKPESISFEREKLLFTLQMHKKCQSFFFASELEVELSFYKDGTMRAVITEPDSPAGSQQFQTSKTEGVLTLENLSPLLDLEAHATVLEDKIVIKDIVSKGMQAEVYSFEIDLKSFKVDQFSNGIHILQVNPLKSLQYSNSDFFQNTKKPVYPGVIQAELDKDCVYEVLRDIAYSVDDHPFTTQRFLMLQHRKLGLHNNIDFRASVSMGFFFPESEHVYGLPQRKYNFTLPRTEQNGPYRLFNQDLFPHAANSTVNLYGSIPYLLTHNEQYTSSVLFVNSADTWVHVLDSEIDQVPQTVEGNTQKKTPGIYSSFVSESGTLEFFIFGSTDSPKKFSRQLADITGYAPLPPVFALGFHYSKWDSVSAQILMERNELFNMNKFQVDVLWQDIEHANSKQYFEFNSALYPQSSIESLNIAIEIDKRRLVVITDPHIRVNNDYPVYYNGSYYEHESYGDPWIVSEEVKLSQRRSDATELTSIFVKSTEGQQFIGKCWPGGSVWFDFFNEHARAYWKRLMDTESFKGTNYLYNYWIDMNEPSVFEQPYVTMPLDNVHMTTNGDLILHRDVHNLYGSMMAKTAFEGLLERNYRLAASEGQNGGIKGVQRPFVLTRSFFIGSQKYGAYWTGDNQDGFNELAAALSMLLSAGISGMAFGGADIPGFFGYPSDHTYALGYQMGVFFPFMRAHSHIESKVREPWLQTPRVQEAIHQSLDLRYKLIHYLYTAFYENSVSGLPIMRPMWYEFPDDKKTFTIETQFMLGSSILVAPKITQKFVKQVDEEQSNQKKGGSMQHKSNYEYQIEVYPKAPRLHMIKKQKNNQNESDRAD